MVGLAIFLCSAAASASAYFLSGWMGAFFANNLLFKHFFPLLTSVVVYFAISIWFGKHYRGHWIECLLKRKPCQYLNRWTDGILCAFLATLFGGVCFGMIFAAISFASEIESSRSLVYNRSLFLRFLLPAEDNYNWTEATVSNSRADGFIDPGPVDAGGDFETTRDAQSLFLEKMGARWGEAKVYLGEKTGVHFVRKRLSAMRFLFNMPREDKEWLLRQYPGLRDLVENPSLQAFLKEDRLFELVNDAANGSVLALYRLGEEKVVQDLFEDKQFHRVVLKIELLEMQAAVQTRLNKEN